MFKVALSETYEHQVAVDFPGSVKPLKFNAVFRRLTSAEHAELSKKARDLEINDREYCKEVMVGWKGVKSEDGEELDFSDAFFDQLLDIYPIPAAIVSAFYESLQGAKSKNFVKPLATGR